MIWANFLHFYQPFDQMPDILEAVVNQSYRPIVRGLKDNPKTKITLNINACLTELFGKYNYQDLIEDLKLLGNRGQIEFTASAKYHAFLPFLPKDETVRQIKINDETNKRFLGDAYQPKGFFSPEMTYTDEIADIVQELGYEWMILDEISYNGKTEQIDYHKIYKIEDSELKVFFRERRISNLIMSAIVRSDKSLYEAIADDIASERYVITGMDGETFGHHRPGLDKMLLGILTSEKYQLVKISDLASIFPKVEKIKPIESNWASSPQDIEKGVQFLSWRDPENPIHAWQKELTDWALERFKNLNQNTPGYTKLREKMDVALASDHFWWASAKPWWSVEMIEIGAFRLLEIINQLPDVKEEEKNRANALYQKIVSTAFEWQRSGKIREMAKEQNALLRIPFRQKAPEEIYESVRTLMNEQMKKASEAQEFEKAILWRDALTKIEEKNDIYDTIHVVDLLRQELPAGKIEELADKYKAEYKKIRGGQPEQRGA